MSGTPAPGLLGRVRHSAYWRIRHTREAARRWWLRQVHRRQLRAMARPRLLEAFAQAYPSAVFVEIGANDGEHEDQLSPLIRSHAWTGVMVEPVPYVFERLRRNYAGLPGVALENAAIADRDGVMRFHHLRDADPEERARLHLPHFYDTLGSFSLDALLRHARDIPDIEERIVTIEVPTLTFDSLLARHGFERVDLVLVDTEGHDWQIVRGIDLARRRPRLLAFEHYHLSQQEAAAARAHFESHGYELLAEGFDTFCLDPVPGDELVERFRALRPAVPAAYRYQESA